MNQKIYRAVGTMIACYLGYHIVVCLLPYIMAFLAAVGVWHLYEEYQRNGRRWK